MYTMTTMTTTTTDWNQIDRTHCSLPRHHYNVVVINITNTNNNNKFDHNPGFRRRAAWTELAQIATIQRIVWTEWSIVRPPTTGNNVIAHHNRL